MAENQVHTIDVFLMKEIFIKKFCSKEGNSGIDQISLNQFECFMKMMVIINDYEESLEVISAEREEIKIMEFESL